MRELLPKPPSEHTPPETPVEFSPQTIIAAEGILKNATDKQPISQDQANQLVDGVARDTIRENTSIPQADVAEEKRKAVQSLTSNLPKEASKEASKEEQPEHIDLKEYANTLNYVGNIYGLNKKRGKLAAMELAMLLHRSMDPLTTIGSQVFSDRISSSAMVTVMQELFEGENKTWQHRGKLVWKLGWPFLAPLVGRFPIMGLDSFAKKQFAKELLHTRDAINDRVAHSIFMRDFEFIHDKSPAEIMNVITKGKQATLDLIQVTYQEILPRVAETVLSVAPLARENIAGVVLGMLKLPIAAKLTEKMTLDFMQQRKQDLLKKDYIDTRILTSLSGLDVVKTSDSMENAMQDLEKMMLAQDELAKDVEIQRIKREKKREQTMGLLDLGIPAAILGWEAVMSKGKSSSTPLQNLEALSGIFGESGTMKTLVYGLKFTSLYGSQAMMSRLTQEIGKLYAEKVQPALQDIKRMEVLLGPVDEIDRPGGMKEMRRVSVSTLPNFDIHISNLRFKNILHGVSMDIPQGSFVTIKGPSGIGKTTFFRHLVGLYGAEKDTVTYGGVDLQGIKKFGDESIYSKIAYANQNPQYFEDLSLRENLLLWTRKQVTNEQIIQVLHDLKLGYVMDRLDSKVKHFSGGELRRIGIARALLKDPRVLYLDEPTANLDEESSRQVLEIIKDMRKTRPDMTVVAVTHDANFEKIAERIVDFREINNPKEGKSATIGSRQMLYGEAKAGD
jgi:ABC-type multidrug transport system fused ATPase/permease subunit